MFRIVHPFLNLVILLSVGLILSCGVGQETISHGPTPTIICHLLL